MAIRIFIFLSLCASIYIVSDSQSIHNDKVVSKSEKKLRGVFKNGDTLTVYLRNKKIKKYINKRHEDETYSFKGKLPNTEYFLFHYEYRSGEVSGYFLVNERNGSQCSVPGKPILSPDGKRFATSCVDLEARYNPNSLTIFRLDKDSCRVEYSVEPTNWGAIKVKWLNNSSIEYRKVVLTEDGMKTLSKSILMLKKKHWLLKE